MFYYRAFGLNIASEVELPELVEGVLPADIEIHYGNVPSSIENPLTSGVRFQASPQLFLLKVDYVARYLIKGGKEIIIQTESGTREEDVRLFLLGSAFGALLHQREMLPLHGSAVDIDGKGYIFSGISGSGKSTFAAALYQKGFNFIADDVCLLTLSGDGFPLVQPGYPQMKLWTDSLMALGKDPVDFKKLKVGIEKHGVYTGARFSEKSCKVEAVFIISPRNKEGFEIDEIKGLGKFTILQENTYRPRFVEGMGDKSYHFRYLTALGDHVKVFRFYRPTTAFLLDEMVQYFIDRFQIREE
jgi:hypothetical protein